MKNNFCCKFRNIGQGLFYTAISKDFSFVYDCGSESKQGLLEPAVKSFINELKNNSSKKDELDLLILSHLDDDHVNGVEDLLKSLKIHTVVIPYLSPLERLLLAYKSKEKSDSYYELLKDPFEYFSERGVKQIIVITGEKGKNEYLLSSEYIDSNREPEFNLENFRGTSLIEDFDQLEDSEEETQIKDEEGISGQEISSTIKVKKSGTIRAGIGWEFSFFAYDNNEDTRKHFDKIIEGFSKEDLLYNLSTRRKRAELRKKYKGIISGKLNNKKINDINNSSLVLLHRPLCRNLLTRIDSIQKGSNYVLGLNKNTKQEKAFYLHKSISRLNLTYRYPHHRINSGTLLFGDIDVRKDLKQIFDFFGKKLEDTGIILVPHHGSENNWDNELLEIFNSIRSLPQV